MTASSEDAQSSGDQFKELGADAARGFGKSDHVLYDLKNILGTPESDLRL
jgi:UDP-N-acetyl-D-galactosamine dehydrogenase